MGSNPKASSKAVHPIIDQLRKIRVAKAISQTELAEKLGYAKNTIGQVEGGVKNLDFRFIVDYANFMGYSLVLIPTEKD